MKKSKFLKSSKDMLSRSFNPSKCKTSLRLAASRLKLLRNKKEVQVKQMKRELAQLLESGQDQTARIRVEHVVREEKMMAAYDLIEIYCELIVARLPIIESQKICPIDLKEAIASVVFASPRCGDVPELLDVKKHFTEKYGKDFITAAIELRPQCGVSRMLVEKLSAVAPDGPTKIKILSAIAEEHNVDWDPKSFQDKNSAPSSDLLNGPSTSEESKLHVEPPRYEVPDTQVSQSNNNMHGSPLNFSQVDHRTSLGTERLASAQVSGVNTAFQHEAWRPVGYERTQLFQGDSNNISLDRQRWNIEFKDATSAAQAAAESAELASMAARAAAELSTRDRIMRQYSTESHKSDVHLLRDDGPERYMNSKLASEQFSEDTTDRSLSEQTRSQKEQKDGMKPINLKTDVRFKEDHHGGAKAYSQSDSLKSKASNDDDSLYHGVPVVDGYSRRNSLKEVSRGEMSTQRQSSKHKAESENGWPEMSENVREERIAKQPSVKSSHSHSSTFDEMNIFSESKQQKSEYDDGKKPFMGLGKAGVYEEASQASSHETAGVFFDKSDSDSDIHGYDMSPTFDEQEPGFHLPLSGQKSREHLSINTDSWSPRSNTSKTVESTSSLFVTRKNASSDSSENLRSMDGSKLDDVTPVTFDESDGPTYESEEEMYVSRHTGISRNLPSKYNQSVRSQLKDKNSLSVGSPLKKKGSSGFDRRQSSLSSDDEMDRERNQGTNFDANPRAKISFGKPSTNQLAYEPKKSLIELNDMGNSSPENEGGLNFPKLTGGLRHKGYNHPPYVKNPSDVSSSLDKESEKTSTRSNVPPNVESPRISKMFEHKKSTKTPNLESESDSDSSEEEEYLRKRSDRKQELNIPRTRKEVKTKPSVAPSNSFFGSDNSDLDDDLPKESRSRTSAHRNGISWRTKASFSSPQKKTYSDIRLTSEALDSDDGVDRKPTTSNIETPIKSVRRNSSKLENREQSTSAKVASTTAKSNYWGPPEHSNSGKATSAKAASKPTISSLLGTSDQHSSGNSNSMKIQETKLNQKSSDREEPKTKPEASVNSENPKSATLNKTSSNKDDSSQKASHVHPKLPDYDTLVQSLWKNRP